MIYNSEIGRTEESHNNHETPGRRTKQKKNSSPFQIEMNAKLEWTQSNAQQNIEQLQNHAMGVTNNNNRLSTDSSQKPRGLGGLNTFHWYQIISQYSAVDEAHKMLCSHAS